MLVCCPLRMGQATAGLPLGVPVEWVCSDVAQGEGGQRQYGNHGNQPVHCLIPCKRGLPATLIGIGCLTPSTPAPCACAGQRHCSDGVGFPRRSFRCPVMLCFIKIPQKGITHLKGPMTIEVTSLAGHHCSSPRSARSTPLKCTSIFGRPQISTTCSLTRRQMARRAFSSLIRSPAASGGEL